MICNSVVEVMELEPCSASPAVCTSGTGSRAQVLPVVGTALRFRLTHCNAYRPSTPVLMLWSLKTFVVTLVTPSVPPIEMYRFRAARLIALQNDFKQSPVRHSSG